MSKPKPRCARCEHWDNWLAKIDAMIPSVADKYNVETDPETGDTIRVRVPQRFEPRES